MVTAAVVACVAVLAVGILLVASGSDDDSSAPDPTTTTFPPSAPTSGSPAAAGESAGASPTAGSPSAATESPTPKPSVTASSTRPKRQVVSIDDTADLASGTTARLMKVEKVTGKAELPGEVGGPAVSVQIRVTAGERLDFATAVVNGYYGGDDTPATPLTDGTAPFEGVLPKGRTATATYVFRVPEAGLGRVTVELDLALGQPLTLFRGAVRP